MNALKSILPIFVVALCAAGVGAQEGYPVLASKGSSALIARPLDGNLRVGTVLLAKRRANGKEIEVARVRIALVDKKYCGVKVIEPLSDSKLKKGDYLVEDVFSFDASLSLLDAPAESTDPGANAPAQPATRPPAREENEPTAPVANKTQPASDVLIDDKDFLSFDLSGDDGSRAEVPELDRQEKPRKNSTPFLSVARPVNTATSFVGPAISGLAPISSMGDSYSAGGQLGVQAITRLSTQTNLRFSLLYSILQPSSTVRAGLDMLGYTQNSSLTILTLSIQPRILNNVLLDVGGGLYRLHDEIDKSGRLTVSSVSALGLVTGLGYRLRISRKAQLMLLGTGNVFFPNGTNAAFFMLTTAYLFTL